MSRSFTYECGCCGSTIALNRYELPEAWVLIKGVNEDVLLCSTCAKQAAEGCEHKEEKLMPTGTMYVQCQACGRQRYVVML